MTETDRMVSAEKVIVVPEKFTTYNLQRLKETREQRELGENQLDFMQNQLGVMQAKLEGCDRRYKELAAKVDLLNNFDSFSKSYAQEQLAKRHAANVTASLETENEVRAILAEFVGSPPRLQAAVEHLSGCPFLYL